MAFPRSDVAPGAAPTATDVADGRTPQGSDVAPTVVKIVVAGGFAVGKTTFIGSISDIEPLSTEAAMTEHSVGIGGQRLDVGDRSDERRLADREATGDDDLDRRGRDRKSVV